jgi:hypothetical protein
MREPLIETDDDRDSNALIDGNSTLSERREAYAESLEIKENPGLCHE